MAPSLCIRPAQRTGSTVEGLLHLYPPPASIYLVQLPAFHVLKRLKVTQRRREERRHSLSFPPSQRLSHCSFNPVRPNTAASSCWENIPVCRVKRTRASPLFEAKRKGFNREGRILAFLTLTCHISAALNILSHTQPCLEFDLVQPDLPLRESTSEFCDQCTCSQVCCTDSNKQLSSGIFIELVCLIYHLLRPREMLPWPHSSPLVC